MPVLGRQRAPNPQLGRPEQVKAKRRVRSADRFRLALALVGSAEVIVTEDQDLLILDPWRGIRIMRLFQFLQDHPLPEL